MKSYNFKTTSRIIPITHPLVMGILNVTPDSFSDGGDYFSIDHATERALEMVENGAEIIDIGGESTRPGSQSVSESEELKRVLPVIEKIRQYSSVTLSIDTTKATVARESLLAGAEIINDISGMKMDAAMPEVLATTGAGAILMHMRGNPQTMQDNLHYDDLMGEIKDYFKKIVIDFEKRGISRQSLMIDPGIGFSKNVAQNLQLINRLDEFLELDLPILLGTSRKSFIGKILGLENPSERVWGTAATVAIGICRGASVIRVHDVKEMSQVSRMVHSIIIS